MQLLSWKIVGHLTLSLLAATPARDDDERLGEVLELRGHEDLLVGEGDSSLLLHLLDEPDHVHAAGPRPEEVRVLLNWDLEDAGPHRPHALHHGGLVTRQLQLLLTLLLQDINTSFILFN